MQFPIIANPETAPPTSLASDFLSHLTELVQTYPRAPHPDFPGYASAPVGALARAITTAGGEPWQLGGFRFPDGSVLRCTAEVTELEHWSTLAPEEACQMVHKLVTEPLEVRLPHAFTGRDGREKRSVAEGVFVYQPDSERFPRIPPTTVFVVGGKSLAAAREVIVGTAIRPLALAGEVRRVYGLALVQPRGQLL